MWVTVRCPVTAAAAELDTGQTASVTGVGGSTVSFCAQGWVLLSADAGICSPLWSVWRPLQAGCWDHAARARPVRWLLPMSSWHASRGSANLLGHRKNTSGVRHRRDGVAQHRERVPGSDTGDTVAPSFCRTAWPLHLDVQVDGIIWSWPMNRPCFQSPCLQLRNVRYLFLWMNYPQGLSNPQDAPQGLVGPRSAGPQARSFCVPQWPCLQGTPAVRVTQMGSDLNFGAQADARL